MIYFSTAETAAIIRKSLKEAFAGIKFSVRSSVYSGGSSISVRWTDGPSEEQVRGVVGHLCGGYFDGSIDYAGSVYHMQEGKEIRLENDHLFFNRDHSDAAIEAAIRAVFERFQGNFRDAGIGMPTVEDFRAGRLWNTQLPGLHHNGRQSVQADIFQALAEQTDRAEAGKSKTAASIFTTGDDGYSRACGAGHSAVSVSL
ncbi:uncharacterized protein E1O_06910 [Burkholderiales bacterium GJ-E10]|nr:uncharacterized protein E1O_06910 [Burkholderiales bacterium GJ-E10]